MPAPLLDERDLEFMLYELFDVESLTERERYSDHNKETFSAAINTSKAVAEKYFLPIRQKVDTQQPTFDGEKVTMIPEIKIALDAVVEAWVNDNRDNDSIRAFRFVESPLVNPTIMARREVFELGYREGPFPEDYDLWLRAMEHGFTFAKLADIVLFWTDGPGRLTRAHPNYTDDAFNRCRREHLLNGPLRNVKNVNFWGAGQTGKPWLRWLKEQGIAVGCVVEVAQRKIGERIHGALVVPQTDLPAPGGAPRTGTSQSPR